MTPAIFTSADFDNAINWTLNGLEVEGRTGIGSLSDTERAAIIQHLREAEIDSQLRQWMIERPMTKIF